MTSVRISIKLCCTTTPLREEILRASEFWLLKLSPARRQLQWKRSSPAQWGRTLSCVCLIWSPTQQAKSSPAVSTWSMWLFKAVVFCSVSFADRLLTHTLRFSPFFLKTSKKNTTGWQQQPTGKCTMSTEKFIRVFLYFQFIILAHWLLLSINISPHTGAQHMCTLVASWLPPIMLQRVRLLNDRQ